MQTRVTGIRQILPSVSGRIPIVLLSLTILQGLGVLSCQALAQPLDSPRDSALHVLNRLAFGFRPGQVDAVADGGIQHWIDGQLEGVPDPGLADRERRFRILSWSDDDLARLFREERKARRAEREAQGEDPPGNPPGTGERNMSEMREVGREFQQLALVRAVTAKNQLQEVLADFWFNHFNVFYRKGADRYLLPGYVEEVIRPRAMGRFEDLLLATAESPAMLLYLDNVRSVAEGAVPPQLERAEWAMAQGMISTERARQVEKARERLPSGLNENYARELLELHTLGVDGGYTQADVIGVARILTGWGMKRPQEGVGFEYHDWAHDRGEKTVLGVRFPARGGQEEGVRLLRLLANHPSTIYHVSRRLVERLVSDDPPDGCVDAAVAAWQNSGGDIREVVRAIVATPEFWSQRHAGKKFKSPLEFVVSAVRAVGGDPDETPRLVGVVAGLGQPIYMQSAPTGYPETESEWLNSGALLTRMNVAVGLAAGHLPGVTVMLDPIIPVTAQYDLLVNEVDLVVLGGAMSERTRRVILEQLVEVRGPEQARALAVGLAIGGPEFQRQ